MKFLEKLYKGTANHYDMIQAKRLTLVRDDAKCKCGHTARQHGCDPLGVPSKCHKYGCGCIDYQRA